MKLMIDRIIDFKIALIAIILLSGCADRLAEINYNANLHKYTAGKYDCRMFAEAKYKALIASGYKDDDIRFIITDYKGQPHVVLNVNGRILDNLASEPYPATKALQGGLTYENWNKIKWL